MHYLIFIFFLFLPAYSFSLTSLSDNELSDITARDGVTIVVDNFDFSVEASEIELLDPEQFNEGSLALRDVLIHDGNKNNAVVSVVMDMDVKRMPDLSLVDIHIKQNTMSLSADVQDILFNGYNLGTLGIEGVSLPESRIQIGTLNSRTGIAGQIEMQLTIDKVQLQNHPGATMLVFEDIMLAETFSGAENYGVTPPYAYYRDDPNHFQEWIPQPDSWEPVGMFKTGDIEGGNPFTLDVLTDNNPFIRYDYIIGNAIDEGWQDPGLADYYPSAQGWEDPDHTNYVPWNDSEHGVPSVSNPRYGKPYIAISMGVKGSLRIKNSSLGSSGRDFGPVMLDNINAVAKMEIPGYGFGNDPCYHPLIEQLGYGQ